LRPTKALDSPKASSVSAVCRKDRLLAGNYICKNSRNSNKSFVQLRRIKTSDLAHDVDDAAATDSGKSSPQRAHHATVRLVESTRLL
jgi:hypothetical protein